MIATDSPAIAALKRSTAPGLARDARLVVRASAGSLSRGLPCSSSDCPAHENPIGIRLRFDAPRARAPGHVASWGPGSHGARRFRGRACDRRRPDGHPRIRPTALLVPELHRDQPAGTRLPEKWGPEPLEQTCAGPASDPWYAPPRSRPSHSTCHRLRTGRSARSEDGTRTERSGAVTAACVGALG
jgi:hypothetical protein